MTKNTAAALSPAQIKALTDDEIVEKMKVTEDMIRSFARSGLPQDVGINTLNALIAERAARGL